MIFAVDYVRDLGAPLGYRVCPLQCTGQLCNRFCPTDARSGQYEPLTSTASHVAKASWGPLGWTYSGPFHYKTLNRFPLGSFPIDLYLTTTQTRTHRTELHC